MRLKEIKKALGCEVAGEADMEISAVSFDSREIKRGQGVLFAAMPGEHTDGRRFVKSAVENGAAAVLAERATEGAGVPQIIVPEIRGALSRISDLVYGEPSKRLALIGVTGTNGKTTVTFLIESILKEAGLATGVVGTVNYRYGGRVLPAPHTTPQAPELQRVLKDMADSGVTHCVMEVSSHALEQKRVADCRFRAGVFTNLTHDHLDYHHTMEEYFRCKSLLFSYLKDTGGHCVVNTDDRWGRLIKKQVPLSLTYGLKEGADIFPEKYALLDGATEAVISTPAGPLKVCSHLVGEYNLQNILAAAGVSHALGISRAAVEKGINGLERVPGRLEKIEAGGEKRFRAYVDYAHTGDALERALEALRKISAGRVITVFGCGGNRDRLKRPEMGGISARLSDVSIITSDNPRDEDPAEIIKEIEAGIKGVKKCGPEGPLDERCYTVIPDRSAAIRKAVAAARSGDTILVAGKGHEDYQIMKGAKTHFNDFEELDSAMRESSRGKKVS